MRTEDWVACRILVVALLGAALRLAAAQENDDWPDIRDRGAADEVVRRTYRLEDFLWTGSGDGEVEPSPRPHAWSWSTTTVFKTTTATTTVLATPTPVYTTSLFLGSDFPRSPSGPIQPSATIPWPGFGDIPSTASPSWTLLNGASRDPDEAYDDSLPDPRFWLVTVLKANGTQDWHLAPDLLEARLARLYRTAFLRQQERHLGIVNATSMGRLRRAPDAVRVTLHNVTAARGAVEPATGAGAARLLYWVRVRGRPVPAATAAHDMRLVSDSEMATELGLPIITKAEPFLSAPVPLAARGRVRDAWLLVAAIGCGVMLLLLILVLVAALVHRSSAKRRRRVTGSERAAQHGGHREGGARKSKHTASKRGHYHGKDNRGFLHDDGHKRGSGRNTSPAFLGVAPGDRSGRAGRSHDKRGPGGASSSATGSGSTSTSGSISCGSSCSGSGSLSDAVLVRRRGGQQRHGKPVHAVNPALVDTLHLAEDDVVTEHPRGHQHASHQHHTGGSHRFQGLGADLRDVDITDSSQVRHGAGAGAASPNSYLSMPSVKQFPRGAALPVPLARVLEPVSVKHLDCDDPIERVGVSPSGPRPVLRHPVMPVSKPTQPPRNDDIPRAQELPRGARHSSLEGDPGVLGPVVWGLRCQRLNSAGSAGEVSLSLSEGGGSPPQVGRMRRRFHELLDDAFSLFAGSRSGSRSASQDEDSNTPSPQPPLASQMQVPIAPQPAPGATQRARSPPRSHEQQRVHSAVERPVGVPLRDSTQRPKTSVSDPKRPSTASAGANVRPRGAWGSDQTVARPLSAGPFHRPQLPDQGSPPGSTTPRSPRVDTALILADSRLPAHDAAVPLIAAIKHELSKFGPPQPPPPSSGSGLPGAAAYSRD